MVFAETEHKHLSQNDRRQSHSVGSDKIRWNYHNEEF